MESCKKNKIIARTNKLMRVSKARKTLLCILLLNLYIDPDLVVTGVHNSLKFVSSRPFLWFPEEVSNARRQGDNDESKTQLGDTFKLQSNSFSGKMIENLEKHTKAKFTNDVETIKKCFRSSSAVQI